mmetsp:Transcript_5854/g.11262  ORF Transcript_5854/g.11262 Transcript_5854/m.11262 type:complete len:95 (-) Transcript_5854:1742-2026(-)
MRLPCIAAQHPTLSLTADIDICTGLGVGRTLPAAASYHLLLHPAAAASCSLHQRQLSTSGSKTSSPPPFLLGLPADGAPAYFGKPSHTSITRSL